MSPLLTPGAPQIKTSRLLLRPWQESDREPCAAMNADPAVMEFFPSTMSPAETDAMLERIAKHFADKGFGLWAVEISGEISSEISGDACSAAPFIGFVGLTTPRFEAHFTPCVEIGWRLAAPYWGHGYATEAARAALHFGFEILRLPQIVSLTSVHNTRSRRVMEKLGLTHDPREDFLHPLLPEGHPLQQHVLYRMANPL